MLQQTNQYLKYTVIAFGILLAVSLIFYFSDNSGDVKWVKYEDAIIKAEKENKPILLYAHNRWAANNKIANKSLFSSDSVVKFIYKNFIPVRLDLNKPQDKKLLKNRYNIENSNFTLVLDKYGRSIGFLDNSWTGAMFISFGKELLKYPFLKFDNFDIAKEKSKTNGKPLIIFVANTSFQNVEFNTKLNDSTFMSYVNSNFTPVALMSYDERDLRILGLYYTADDPVLKFNKEEKSSSLAQYTSAPPPNILIVSIENGIMGKLTIDKNLKEDWKMEIEKILNKSK
jgi:hypothetical protein